MKTVRQLADEIGVTKQAVRKQVEKLPSKLVSTGDNRAILINDDGVKIIKERMSTSKPLVDTNQVATVDTLVDMLQRELDSKNTLIESQNRHVEEQAVIIREQGQSIKELTAALENTTASLHAAQALHAGTMHKQLDAGAGDPQQEEAAEPAHQEPEKKPGLFARIFGTK